MGSTGRTNSGNRSSNVNNRPLANANERDLELLQALNSSNPNILMDVANERAARTQEATTNIDKRTVLARVERSLSGSSVATIMGSGRAATALVELGSADQRNNRLKARLRSLGFRDIGNGRWTL